MELHEKKKTTVTHEAKTRTTAGMKSIAVSNDLMLTLASDFDFLRFLFFYTYSSQYSNLFVRFEYSQYTNKINLY